MTANLHLLNGCAWCGQTFAPNTHGRPRIYCNPECRRQHGRYVEALPRWQADLAQSEAAARGYRVVPTFLTNEIAGLRALIAARPRGAAPPPPTLPRTPPQVSVSREIFQ